MGTYSNFVFNVGKYMSAEKDRIILKVKFSQTLEDINKRLFPKNNRFGVKDFRQWIESFETAEVEELSERGMIVSVSGENSLYVRRWLVNNLSDLEIII